MVGLVENINILDPKNSFMSFYFSTFQASLKPKINAMATYILLSIAPSSDRNDFPNNHVFDMSNFNWLDVIIKFYRFRKF